MYIMYILCDFGKGPGCLMSNVPDIPGREEKDLFRVEFHVRSGSGRQHAV